jgi:predicted nucleic acid-binding protein
LIVADTSPLSAFLRVHRVDLLSGLLGSLVIPGAVAMELDRGASLVGAWRQALPFVEVRAVDDSPLLALLRADLDPGEAEAIALAVEAKAKLLLIDEVKGRALAQRLGLKVLGSVGVCVLAKERGLIAAARPLLDDLRHRGGRWFSDALLDEVLSRIGE